MTPDERKYLASIDPTSLGSLLLRARVLQPNDLRDGLEYADRCNQSREPGVPEMKLGEALAEIGRIDSKLVEAILAQQGYDRAQGVAKTHAAADMITTASASLLDVVRRAVDALDRETHAIRFGGQQRKHT